MGLSAGSSQTIGGPRARKRRCDDVAAAEFEAAQNVIGLIATGTGNPGAAAGTALPAKLATAQMAQKSNASPGGLIGAAGVSGEAAERPSATTTSCNPPKDDPISKPCACPNDKTNWIASANSAHPAPDRIFDRTQRIPALIQVIEFL